MMEAWTKKDVAAFLKCNVRTVERLGIPRVEIQGAGLKPMVRYDADQVREWWERRKTATQGTSGARNGMRAVG